MTYQEAFDIANAVRKDAVTPAEAWQWLSELDGRIETEIHGKSPNGVKKPMAGCEACTRLSAPAPYDRVYWTYLLAMGDLLAGDSAAYAASRALYREAYEGYARWYQRTGGGRA